MINTKLIRCLIWRQFFYKFCDVIGWFENESRRRDDKCAALLTRIPRAVKSDENLDSFVKKGTEFPFLCDIR